MNTNFRHHKLKTLLYLKSLIAWLAILCLAVANGAIREAVLVPALGKPAGLVLSGVLLCILLIVACFWFVWRVHGLSASQGLAIGVIWLCLTLAFEFSFGLYVQHKSWAELLSAYTFREGNIWPVVLAVILLAPSLAARFHAKSRDASSGN